MSFLYADSWDSLTAIGDTSFRGWTNVGTPALETTIKKDGANSVRLDNADNVNRAVTSSDILFSSFWIYRTATTQATFFRAQGTSGGTDEFSLRAETDNTIDIIQPQGTVQGTSAAVFTINTWHHIEFKCRMNASTTAADVILKVNGVTEFSDAGATDTSVTDTAFVYVEFESGAVATEYMYVDNPVFWSAAGGDDWTGLKGMLRIEVLRPNADGNQNTWDGSDGNQVNNFEMVDEAGLHDDGATDVSSSTLNEIDEYNYPALSGDIATIAGVHDVLVAERSSGPARSISNTARVAATDYVGSANVLTAVTQVAYFHMWDQDPNTSVAWIEAGVNAAEFGVKITT